MSDKRWPLLEQEVLLPIDEVWPISAEAELSGPDGDEAGTDAAPVAAVPNPESAV
jgi:hypothetical protein